MPNWLPDGDDNYWSHEMPRVANFRNQMFKGGKAKVTKSDCSDTGCAMIKERMKRCSLV